MAKNYSTLTARFKQEARKMRLDFDRVRYFYEQIKEGERAKREHPNYIRQTAWAHFKAHSPGCWDFWRHGFYYTYRHRFAKGADYTCIPGYDNLAQTMAELFPEYQGSDGTERLWEFLLSPYDKLPTAEKCWLEAFNMAYREKKKGRAARGKGREKNSEPEEAIPF